MHFTLELCARGTGSSGVNVGSSGVNGWGAGMNGGSGVNGGAGVNGGFEEEMVLGSTRLSLRDVLRGGGDLLYGPLQVLDHLGTNTNNLTV